VDSTAGAQELGEHKDNVPWSFLCPDAADQELYDMACWQIAAWRLETMQDQAEAIRKEEELAANLGEDTTGRKVLMNTVKEFQTAVGKITARTSIATLERALQADAGPPATEAPDGDSEKQAMFSQRAGSTKDLIVPTGRMYANMWQPGFWQEWNPMLWCYGDCVYGDPKRNEEPYKQPTFK
jgi:hypothetical protein